MTIQGAKKVIVKKRESLLHKEILFLKKRIIDYKEERKTSWKLFKSKVNEDIGKLETKIAELNDQRDAL
jgi:hypothetical protein